MKFTIPGKDVIKVTDDNYIRNEVIQSSGDRIHLIKFDFDTPSYDKVKWVLDEYPYTNRFIVYDNIKIYNDLLKKTTKKYYVENNYGDSLISFFKKNNKVILNFLKLDRLTLEYIVNVCLEDVLYNTEVICINDEIYKEKKNVINLWKGNVIILNNDYDL